MSAREEEQPTAFHDLTPDVVIASVEAALGVRCTNLFRPLNSYINRVYELEREDGGLLVAKFYRPGRWSREALLDEHDFMRELVASEVPIVAPLELRGGGTLGSRDGMHFAVYPKKSGRVFDEYTAEQWVELGRLIGRVHVVGSRLRPRDRITLAPDRSTRGHVDFILAGGFVPPDLAGRFGEVTGAFITDAAPLFGACEMIAIHGDCHTSNLIYRPGESFFIIDFDDMAIGPPVQDFWMLLPGYRGESLAEIDDFLEGYETFRPFDRRTLGLIGPLRAMRFIHYMAWCAHQVAEDGHSRVAPDFGTRPYWLRELADLEVQVERVRAGLRREEE
ncbi:MAG TPA: serine/threonine protein kinase [Candidatus Methanoperedens sp.]|nr:serine/threonine protein kinase [Candidatus Methanoperedens sp.]